ncbi:MAG TPA: S8 family serine peptidase, partial [Anaerolineae bacterium]|nr:S8 family serine peptidase [Anaerolineae bacterium]
MSRKLYKLFAVAVSISMIIALPALAQPVSSPAAPKTQPASITSHSSQPVSQIAQPPALPRHPQVPPAGDDHIQLKDPQMPKSGPVAVIIELQDEPAAATYAAAKDSKLTALQTVNATQQQISRIDVAQKQLLPSLAKMGATVIYRIQRTYNGIAVQVDVSKVKDLEALPGVKAVHPLISKTLDNWHSVPLIGAPQLWDAAGYFGGLDGTGVKVGIIDTGIDYIHADFGGPATQAAYNANGTTVVTDTYNSQLLFPTAKVVGGYDFAGDAYDADGTTITQTLPHPDPDPMDCNGHGTHVAGTTAGYGVNSDGSTYTGTYNSGLNFSAFKIGPGVAPKAQLYALRVFGCEGSTNLVGEAIDWAIDPNNDGDFSDHLDVVNMSLGSDYGDSYDSDAVASDYASLAGVIVVASAGNGDDVYYVAGSPANAERAISVAASHSGAGRLDGFAVTAPITYAGVYPASESAAYNWLTTTLPITGKLVYPLPGSNPAQDQRTGCYTFDITNTQLISGNIVLLDWNTPSCGGSATRSSKAVAAHAIGAILVNNDGPFELSITGSPIIPVYSTLKAVGDQLKTAINGASPVMVVMTNQYQGQTTYSEPEATDVIASFSSRGPARTASILKPDITAPGAIIFSARSGSGTEGVGEMGTSMAAPHIAGSMALLKQLHPGWSVEELKSLAMNTATTDITQLDGALPAYDPGRVGAGRITLPNAASSNVIAFNATEPYLTSVSFGAVEVNGTAEATKMIKVVNKGTQPVKYSVNYQAYAEVPGVEYTVSPALVEVPANGSAFVTVKMTADASQMKHSADPTIELDGERSWLSEASGYVVLSPLNYKVYLPLIVKSGSSAAVSAYTPSVIQAAPVPVELRVPVYAAPRPSAHMYAATSSIAFTGITGTATIPVTGTGINTGSNYPYDIVSLATAYELAEVSPNDQGYVGTDNADLKYVGVTNDNRAMGGSVANTTLYFGISTWGDHNVPYGADAEFDIYLDTNRDGNWDYVVYNNASGDIFFTTIVNLTTTAAIADQFVNITPAFDTYPYNNNVMVMPISAASIGLSTANPRFDYQIVTFSREDPTGGPVDATAKHTYSAATAGLDFTNNPLELPGTVDLPGSSVNVAFNYAAYALNGSKGVLLLHHHNAASLREEVVPVTTPSNYAAVTIMHT